jgi:hypothetical protein
MAKVLDVLMKDSYGGIEIVSGVGDETIRVYKGAVGFGGGMGLRPPIFAGCADVPEWIMRWFCLAGDVTDLAYRLAVFLAGGKDLKGFPQPQTDEVAACVTLLRQCPVELAAEYEPRLVMVLARAGWTAHEDALLAALREEPPGLSAEGEQLGLPMDGDDRGAAVGETPAGTAWENGCAWCGMPTDEGADLCNKCRDWMVERERSVDPGEMVRCSKCSEEGRPHGLVGGECWSCRRAALADGGEPGDGNDEGWPLAELPGRTVEGGETERAMENEPCRWCGHRRARYVDSQLCEVCEQYQRMPEDERQPPVTCQWCGEQCRPLAIKKYGALSVCASCKADLEQAAKAKGRARKGNAAEAGAVAGTA